MTKEVFVLATHWPYEGYSSPFAAYSSYAKAVVAQSKTQETFSIYQSEQGPKVQIFTLEIADDE